jgi:hypothetical protein
MLLGSESSQARPHPQIVVGQVQRLSAEAFAHGMSALALAIRMNDELELRRALGAMVPEATLAVPREHDVVRSIRLERPAERLVVVEEDLRKAAANDRSV